MRCHAVAPKMLQNVAERLTSHAIVILDRNAGQTFHIITNPSYMELATYRFSSQPEGSSSLLSSNSLTPTGATAERAVAAESASAYAACDPRPLVSHHHMQRRNYPAIAMRPYVY